MRAPVIITGMATAPPVVGPPPGWTPSLTIAKSAPNPLAGAPLTLYIGETFLSVSFFPLLGFIFSQFQEKYQQAYPTTLF